MKTFTLGKAAAGVVLRAGLLMGAVASRSAHANILLKEEGQFLVIRNTMKGAQGNKMRVRRDSPNGRRALV